MEYNTFKYKASMKEAVGRKKHDELMLLYHNNYTPLTLSFLLRKKIIDVQQTKKYIGNNEIHKKKLKR